MFKISLLVALTLAVSIQCDSSLDTSGVVKDGFAFEMIMTKLKLVDDRIALTVEQIENSSEYQYCSAVSSSGVYKIQPEKPFKLPITVLCDQEYESGGWVVIQHRFDGSTNFYRNWKEYKNGFGNLQGEFWLGLDRIYQLTVSRPHELVVLLEDFEGNKTTAKYDEFEIGHEDQKYVVTKIGAYTGTAGDSFSGTK
uniref:Fibrinogen C-terminal domain-containing protein n=1 Tax=Anopheles maculatus TaxID=74869 RepID=A0A182SXT8_9DIPT